MGKTLVPNVNSYDEAHALFEARNAKRRTDTVKFANNTYLVRGPSKTDLERVLPPGTHDEAPLYYSVRLHDTDIVRFHANGDVTLSTGGWKTRTTRDRMRAFFPRSGFPSDSELAVRPRLRWSLEVKRDDWSVVCERIVRKPGETPESYPSYDRTVVKRFAFDDATLELEHAPRTQGGFRLKREAA